MENNVRIALLEYDIQWENPEANFEFLTEQFKQFKADLVLLPEMFSTGFTMEPEKVAEPYQGKSFQFLNQLAQQYNCYISTSIATQIGEGEYYNRMYWITPSDDFMYYDKRHLFRYGKEQLHYNDGNRRKLFWYKDWKLFPQICYDLRFPVWCRNSLDYDLMYVVANWPTARIEAWETLLRARAMENMAYVVGVNRIGTDGNGLEYNGKSAIYDPLGKPVKPIEQGEFYYVFELDKNQITDSRNKYGFLKDMDDFELKNL